MRAERVDADDADAGQGPQRAEGDRGDGEPAPHPEARERERGGGHHRQIDVERPVIRPLRGDEKRRDIGADEAEARQRRPMQQRGGKRRQRHQAEQDESRAGGEKAVERMGGVDVGIGDGGAGGGQDARDVRGRQAGEAGEPLGPARPFARGDERGRQQCAERDPHAAVRAGPARSSSVRERCRRARAQGRRPRPPIACRDAPRSSCRVPRLPRRERARMRRLPARVRSARPAPAQWARPSALLSAASSVALAFPPAPAAPTHQVRARRARVRSLQASSRPGAIARRARRISPARRWP